MWLFVHGIERQAEAREGEERERKRVKLNKLYTGEVKARVASSESLCSCAER